MVQSAVLPFTRGPAARDRRHDDTTISLRRDRRVQRLVGQRTGTTGVDPLHMSGDIVYTLDAMDRDERRDGTRTIRTRLRLGRLDDDRAV